MYREKGGKRENGEKERERGKESENGGGREKERESLSLWPSHHTLQGTTEINKYVLDFEWPAETNTPNLGL